MSARARLNSAIRSIDDAGRVIKRIRNATDDSDVHYQLRKAARELDEARQYIDHALREMNDLER
jgi:DNA mismatch repair ATPase MutS